jgi:hypothetical protein
VGAALAVGSAATGAFLLSVALRGPATIEPALAADVSPPARLVTPPRGFERVLPPPALLPAPASPRPSSVQLQRGLIGYWSFDEEGAGLAFDGSGNQNTCHLQDVLGRPARADRVAGIAGQALPLDGEHFLSCARPEPLAHLQTAMSISLWARPADRGAEPQVLVARHLGGVEERYFSIALRGGALELSSQPLAEHDPPPAAGRHRALDSTSPRSTTTAAAPPCTSMASCSAAATAAAARTWWRSQRAHPGRQPGRGGRTLPGRARRGADLRPRLGQAELRALAARPPEQSAPGADKFAMSHQ